jgi:hypothetical protein
VARSLVKILLSRGVSVAGFTTEEIHVPPLEWFGPSWATHG